MSDPIEVNRLNWDERARIHAHDKGGMYRRDDVLVGRDTLCAIEAGEIGDISGKRVLHLQCHMGHDTLSLARRGATVTGLDFSSEAIRTARLLAQATRLAATFVEGRVEDAARLTPGPFDLVYATWGTLCWLPDLHPWAEAIAQVLAPGGELYLADAHPGFNLLDLRDNRLVPVFDNQTAADAPLVFTSATTYTGDPTLMQHQETREWLHSLSTILTAMLDAGLHLTMFREHDVLTWQAHPIMVSAGDRLWRLPDDHSRLPLSFSLRATRSGTS